ncbi:MAG: hypothetical protein OXG39_10000 [Chloroflexi bacterium]|nr:hypothetical protein [Chloroflexota bacterium]
MIECRACRWIRSLDGESAWTERTWTRALDLAESRVRATRMQWESWAPDRRNVESRRDLRNKLRQYAAECCPRPPWYYDAATAKQQDFIRGLIADHPDAAAECGAAAPPATKGDACAMIDALRAARTAAPEWVADLRAAAEACGVAVDVPANLRHDEAEALEALVRAEQSRRYRMARYLDLLAERPRLEAAIPAAADQAAAVH